MNTIPSTSGAKGSKSSCSSSYSIIFCCGGSLYDVLLLQLTMWFAGLWIEKIIYVY